MRFNLQDGFLWLLQKITPKIDYIQLLWFLKEIQYKVFTRKWVKIWDAWADANGDLGPVYGQQWRNWNGEEIDQISDLSKS
jgi:thymidylate synthase